MKRIYIICVMMIIMPSLIHSEEWHVKKSEENLVKFISSTPLLDFEGITSNIDGFIYWEGDKIFGDNNEIYFEVDLNTVETGIGKRDRDMREDVLETDEYPRTYFKGRIERASEDENLRNKYDVVSVGNFFLHGVSKEITVNADITILDGIMNVSCDFSIFLKDFEIEAPTLLAFIKVAEEIKLKLNFNLEKISENEN